MAQILRYAVQIPPTPPPHPPPDHGKLPSSLLRVHTSSLPRVNPPPLPRVSTSPTHRYPTRHTRHNQPRPAIAIAAATAEHGVGVNPVSPPNTLKVPIPSYLFPSTPSPKKKQITYANFFFDINLSKTETHRVRLTVGGNKLTYNGNPSSP